MATVKSALEIIHLQAEGSIETANVEVVLLRNPETEFTNQAVAVGKSYELLSIPISSLHGLFLSYEVKSIVNQSNGTIVIYSYIKRETVVVLSDRCTGNVDVVAKVYNYDHLFEDVWNRVLDEWESSGKEFPDFWSARMCDAGYFFEPLNYRLIKA